MSVWANTFSVERNKYNVQEDTKNSSRYMQPRNEQTNKQTNTGPDSILTAYYLTSHEQNLQLCFPENGFTWPAEEDVSSCCVSLPATYREWITSQSCIKITISTGTHNIFISQWTWVCMYCIIPLKHEKHEFEFHSKRRLCLSSLFLFSCVDRPSNCAISLHRGLPNVHRQERETERKR
jgi:hypothetical protein